ncbi:MAG: hypothetical protein ABSA02_22240 [Trebonia sp.]
MTEAPPGRARHGRARHGRPARRADGAVWRVLGAIAAGVVAVVIAGWSPGVIGVLTGVLTWLLVAAWHALLRRRSN